MSIPKVVTAATTRPSITHSSENRFSSKTHCSSALLLSSLPGLTEIFNKIKEDWNASSHLQASVLKPSSPLSKYVIHGAQEVCKAGAAILVIEHLRSLFLAVVASETVAEETSQGLTLAASAAIPLAAALGKHVMSTAMVSSLIPSPSLSPADSSIDGLEYATSSMRRRLLEELTTTVPTKMNVTEEVSFQKEWYTWDNFQNSDGSRISLTAKQSNGQPLPNGITLKAVPMNVIASYSVAGNTFIAYKDNYAFIGTTTGLRVVDISDPQKPVLASGIDLPNLKDIQGLTISGNLCIGLANQVDPYLASTFLFVVDISDPHNPKQLGSPLNLNLYSYSSIEVEGNYCFVPGMTLGINIGRLSIIDMSDPTNCTIANSLEFPTAQGLITIKIENNIAYTGGGGSGSFFTVDVRNPRNATIISSLSSIGTVYSLDISHSRAYLGTSNGLVVVDASNPSNLRNNATYFSGKRVTNVKIKDNSCLIISSNLLKKIDISDPSNLKAISQLPVQCKDFVMTNTNYLILDGDVNLQVSNLGDTFSLQGTPEGGVQGTYDIDITGTSTGVTQTKSIQLTINPALALKSQASSQRLIVGSLFNQNIDIFDHVKDALITYSATLANGTPIPSWLTISSSGALTGTPPLGAAGVINLKITGQDAQGAISSTIMQLTILNSPYVNRPVTNQITSAGNPFSFKLPSDTFLDRDNDKLELTASGSLPTWLTFNSATQTLEGTPPRADIGQYPILLTATDPTNLPISLEFMLNVVQELPPVIGVPLVNKLAQTGEEFTYTIPDNTFISSSTDTITYSVSLGDGSPLPPHMKYDAATRTISGVFSRSDLKYDGDGIITVKVTGKGISTENSSTFIITVQGTTWGQIAQYVGPTAGALFTGLVALPQALVMGWNSFRKKQYQLPIKELFVGDTSKVVHTITVPRREIQEFKTQVDGDKLPGSQLPSWIIYDEDKNALKTVPTGIPESAMGKIYTIQTYRKSSLLLEHTGRIMEEFNIVVKPYTRELDLEAPISNTSSASNSPAKDKISHSDDKTSHELGSNQHSSLERQLTHTPPFGTPLSPSADKYAVTVPISPIANQTPLSPTQLGNIQPARLQAFSVDSSKSSQQNAKLLKHKAPSRAQVAPAPVDVYQKV